jgi:hypothetical protein
MSGAMGGGGERRLIQLDTIKLLRSFMFVRAASSVAIRLWHKHVGAVACKTKHCETHQGAGRGMSNRKNGTDLAGSDHLWLSKSTVSLEVTKSLGSRRPIPAAPHRLHSPIRRPVTPRSSKRCPSFTRRVLFAEQLSYFRGGPDGRARHGRGGEHLGSQLRRNGDFDWLPPQ